MQRQWKRLRYDYYAPFYDLMARPLQRSRRRAVELVDLQPEERVLIVGVGTGLDLPHLPPDQEVMAVDRSAPMLRQAEDRARKLDREVTFRSMDAHALDLPDVSFDVVLLHLVLAVVPDPHAAIREVARVLRPGGRVSVFDKFLADDADPSRLRRYFGAVTDVLFSDINLRLGPLLEEANLTPVRERSLFLGGMAKAVIARKPEDDEAASAGPHRPA